MIDVPLTAEERASDHLALFGDVGFTVRRLAQRAGVTLVQLLGGDRSPHVVACRTKIIRTMSGKGWSGPAIGRLLQLDRSTVWHHLRKSQPRGKAAA